MKKRIGILAIMILIPAILIGCKPKIQADQSAKILAEFVIKNNSSEMSKLGDSKSSVYLSMESQKDNFKKGFKNGFEKTSGIALEDREVDEFYKAYINAMKKINITTNKVSESDKTAKVNVKVTYIDLKTIIFSGINKVLDLEVSGKSKEEESKEYIENVIKELNNAKPSTKTKEKTFSFIVKDNIWVPQDERAFSKEILDLSLGDIEVELNKLKMEPDKSAKVLFDFYIKGDKTGDAKTFAELTGKSYGDKIESMKQEEFNKSLKKSFIEQGITIGDDDCNRIYSAYQNAMKNITVTSSKLSQSGNTAMVSLKSNYLDFSNISKTAGLEAVSDITAKGLTDKDEATTEVVKAFVSHFEKGLNAAKPGTEMKERTFKFVLKGFMWVPADSRDFGNQIESMLSGN